MIRDMSEDSQPPLIRRLGDDQPIVVALEWEGDDLRWVNVEPDWYELVGPAGLIGQTRRAYQATQAVASDWRLEISLNQVAVEDLKEFGQLLTEALASESDGPQDDPLWVRTRNLESQWSGSGRLMRISDPDHWLWTATRQAVCDELTAVLQRPPIREITQTREVRRLMAFVGKGSVK